MLIEANNRGWALSSLSTTVLQRTISLSADAVQRHARVVPVEI
jgi:hypothetical protein